jgi:hypothetical protein
VVRAIVRGSGGEHGCRGDKDCAPASSAVGGACVLGTCFGLLTTDSAPVRAVLADRLRRAPLAVRSAAAKELLAVLGGWQASGSVRAGAVAGLAAIVATDPSAVTACGEVCLALRAEAAAEDPRRAVAARLALGTAGDAAVVPELLIDLREGTELLRSQAVLALAPAAGRGDAAARSAQKAIIAALDDPSPAVADAAVAALERAAADPTVRKALEHAREHGAGRLRYAVDRVLAAPSTKP